MDPRPTTIGSQEASLTNIAPAIALSATLAAAFPMTLTEQDVQAIQEKLERFDIASLPQGDIALLMNEPEKSLHQTLDGFLSRIDRFENPRIFSLIRNLGEEVDKSRLDALADQILNGKLGFWERLMTLASKKGRQKALERLWEETLRMASGKTKTLVDVVNQMEHELATEQQKLTVEMNALESLKESYRDRFREFAIAVSMMRLFLDKSKAHQAHFESTANLGDPLEKAAVEELKDKVQALESRTLALEGVLSRLPADQLVIRQLQNAGSSTLQETVTTASSRFASIKMTLLTLHTAMVTKGVQQLADYGAKLDENLAAVRGQLMKDVVSRAANAPGDNRLSQAKQLQGIIADTKALVTIVDTARSSNAQKFDEARKMFADARKDLLGLNQQVAGQSFGR